VKIEVIVGLAATAPGALTTGAEVSCGTGVTELTKDSGCNVSVGISIWASGTFQPAAEAMTAIEMSRATVINKISLYL
jgi:hypothetical protein